MVYTDETRQADLTGKVRVEDPDGVMTSDHARVFLTPAPAAGAAKTPPPASTFMGGQVQRVVAAGDVRVEQPGRHADGQELVYTADDRTFVMTGTKDAPPKMVSDGRNGDTPGTVVGSSLRFRSGDNSVLVQGGDAKDGPQRVTTETRMKPETKSNSAAPKKVKP